MVITMENSTAMDYNVPQNVKKMQNFFLWRHLACHPVVLFSKRCILVRILEVIAFEYFYHQGLELRFALLWEGLWGLGPPWEEAVAWGCSWGHVPTCGTRRMGSPPQPLLWAAEWAPASLPPWPGTHLPNTICRQPKHMYLMLDPGAGGKLRSCCVVAWDWSTTLRRVRWGQMNVWCLKDEAWQVWHCALWYCFWLDWF